MDEVDEAEEEEEQMTWESYPEPTWSIGASTFVVVLSLPGPNGPCSSSSPSWPSWIDRPSRPVSPPISAARPGNPSLDVAEMGLCTIEFLPDLKPDLIALMEPGLDRTRSDGFVPP